MAIRIDGYSFGKITIDGKQYVSDLIIYPDRVDDKWWRQEGHLLQMEDLEEVFASKPVVLIVGQGQPGLMKVDPKVETYCHQNNIKISITPTEQAVEEFNRSTGTKEKVIACLHLTC